MSYSPNTRLVDEDAPTTIDRTLGIATDVVATEAALPRLDVCSGRGRMSRPNRSALLAVLCVVIFGSLLGALIRQRAVAAQLRRELASLRRTHVASHIETRSASQIRARPPSNGSSKDVTKLSREELERHAVDALVDSDFAKALVYYEALAERSPNESVFADFVSVLRLKSRCATLSAREGASCR